jgi:hypothetical protein
MNYFYLDFRNTLDSESSGWDGAKFVESSLREITIDGWHRADLPYMFHTVVVKTSYSTPLILESITMGFALFPFEEKSYHKIYDIDRDKRGGSGRWQVIRNYASHLKSLQSFMEPS